jgi:mRNA interferase MazF
MGRVAAGQVVFLPFPYSDLSDSKLRPAILLASVDRGDWIACQITSNPYSDGRAVELTPTVFSSGGLKRVSYAKPGRLFSANESLITSTVGTLTPSALQIVREAVVAVIRQVAS